MQTSLGRMEQTAVSSSAASVASEGYGADTVMPVAGASSSDSLG